MDNPQGENSETALSKWWHFILAVPRILWELIRSGGFR